MGPQLDAHVGRDCLNLQEKRHEGWEGDLDRSCHRREDEREEETKREKEKDMERKREREKEIERDENLGSLLMM